MLKIVQDYLTTTTQIIQSPKMISLAFAKVIEDKSGFLA